jgi:DNA-binding XRE family transcriptional regulator
MKNQEQEQAKELYFQTNMSKTEIAASVGVNRRTILLWSKQGNWDKLRDSARHLPAMIAEKCYYLIDRFTTGLLQDASLFTLSFKDAQTIHLMASSIKKLKNRNTVNESMEMFNFFYEGLKKKNPELAAEVLPEIEEYITSRSDRETNDFLIEGFTQNGVAEYPDQESQEQYADDADLQSLEKEIQSTGGNQDLAIQNWLKDTGTHQP